MITYAEWLTDHIHANYKGINECAAAAHINKDNMRHAAKGDCPPNDKQWVKIANLFGTTVDQIKKECIFEVRDFRTKIPDEALYSCGRTVEECLNCTKKKCIHDINIKGED